MTTPWSTFTSTSDDLFRDIQATFLSTYRDVVGANPKLGNVMRLGLPSDKRSERYGYFESPPTIERIDRGEAIPEQGLKGIAYEVTNLKFGKAIGFEEEDLEDLQLGDLREVAGLLGRRTAELPERILFQILTGSSDASLLKSIPTSPDGASLYATTAGGSARFGVTSGNLLSGGGVATAAAVRQDFWAAVAQAMQFQDTEGQPLLGDAAVSGGATVLFGASNLEVFQEAFKQTRTVDSNAAVTNTVQEAYAGQVDLWPTQRITDNTWCVFFNAISPKAVFEQMRRAPRMIDETRENSSRARRYGMFGSLLDMRVGYGINVPYATIKIS